MPLKPTSALYCQTNYLNICLSLPIFTELGVLRSDHKRQGSFSYVSSEQLPPVFDIHRHLYNLVGICRHCYLWDLIRSLFLSPENKYCVETVESK